MRPSRDIWAVVPVKQLALAKSRLAPALSASARGELARAMLEDVLAALAAARSLAGLVVVTVDPIAAAIARRYGGRLFGDDATDGHTRAVMGATRRLDQEGRGGMLTVPGDIPGLCAEEVDGFLARHQEAPAFTIAPAHDGRGSNAIAMSPPGAVPLAFGNDSYLPHLAAARRAGIEPAVVTCYPGIALDIDGPEDAAALLRARFATRARAVLSRHATGLAQTDG